MDNAGTPTNHGEEKNDIEFLMNIDREILVICVYSNARRGVNRVVSLGAHLKLYFWGLRTNLAEVGLSLVTEILDLK